MKIDRRDLLKMGLMQWVASALPIPVQAESGRTLPKRQGLSILQGATDDTKTQFSILCPVSMDLEVFVLNSRGERWQSDKTEVFQRQGEPYKVVRVFFSELASDDIFHLHVFERGAMAELDVREFQVLNLREDTVRFAMCSCMNDERHEPEIWRTLIREKPEVIFFIGDAVYADKGADRRGATPLHLWRRFCEARLTLEIYYSQRLIPIVAVWDDHDLGSDDAGAETYAYVKESQKNFLQFFAQEESHCRWLRRGP